jgi:hypothetical protein
MLKSVPMGSALRVGAVCAGLVLAAATAPAPASAAVLLAEDFTGATIADGLTVTASSNLGQWIDFPNSNRWQIQSGGICAAPCSGAFAQHLVQTSDNTNLLYYGISGAGIGAGSTLSLDLSYITSNRNGRAYIAGITGTQEVDPFAPWFSPGDANDAVVLASLTLGQTGTWQSGHLEVVLGQAYNALVIAFEMGGTTGSRGVDNVLFQVVPEPATLALLGFAFAGLGFGRRRTSG